MPAIYDQEQEGDPTPAHGTERPKAPEVCDLCPQVCEVGLDYCRHAYGCVRLHDREALG